MKNPIQSAKMISYYHISAIYWRQNIIGSIVQSFSDYFHEILDASRTFDMLILHYFIYRLNKIGFLIIDSRKWHGLINFIEPKMTP